MNRLQIQSRLPQRDASLLLACVFIAGLVARHQPVISVPAPVDRTAISQPITYGHHDYFGGRPARGLGTPLKLGGSAAGFWAALLPSLAAPQVAASCIATAAPGMSGVSAPAKIAADLPGLYGAPWVGSMNGYLIAALNVTVPRNPARAPAAPILQIYRQGAVTPAFSQTVPVSVVRGSNALLYRMFIDGPIRCIDLVIPNGAGAGTAYLYYPLGGRLFEAVGQFAVQR